MQVGAPQFLYDNPANIFVAGFIGSPPMNMGMGSLSAATATTYTLRLGSSTLTLAPELLAEKPGLKQLCRQRRSSSASASEDMEDASIRKDASEVLHAHVVLTEALGSEIVVHFETDIHKVVTEDTKMLAEDSGESEVAVDRPRQDEVGGVVRAAVPGQSPRRHQGRRGHRTAALLRRHHQ